jgi:hypothetical protein
MAGNAHRNRPRKTPCPANCKFCAARPQDGDYKNSNGNRHNPAAKKRGKRAKK